MAKAEIADPAIRPWPKNLVRLSRDITFVLSATPTGYDRCIGWSNGAEKALGWKAHEVFLAHDPVTFLFGADVATVEWERARQFMESSTSNIGSPQYKWMRNNRDEWVEVLLCGSIGACEGPTGLAMVATAVLV